MGCWRPGHSASDMERARQVIERAAALIAQNFENELSQARSMLTGLTDYAQDPRFRTVVSDLLARHLERAASKRRFPFAFIEADQDCAPMLHDRPLDHARIGFE